MKLLILGGTVFLGRHLVDAALARGHEVTLFNRGQHNPELYPDVEKLRGDRDGNLEALRGRTWDAVIDTCGYVPRVVRDAAALLADAVEHYTFISSISVYPDFSQSGLDESAPVGTLEDERVEEVTGETYGPLKALCEQAAEEAMRGRVLQARAGLIVGPHDQSDRFTYWPHRVAQGGDVLAPPPAAPTQFIDVRDLAAWCVRMAEIRQTGVFNVTGPAQPLTLQTVLEACQQVADNNAELVWTTEEFLHAQLVTAWVELPLWLPKESHGLDQVDLRKVLATGITYRPLAETIADTLAWSATRPADHKWRAGLESGREAELLRAWHHRSAG
ncbi:MAG: hypothetical protein KDE54_09875 [Caldilineaceae bacterium]|nr:hypothetical protein [Caldilineaceae bacterium]